MLPERWKRVPLGEIAQITSGGTPDRAQPAYWGGDIPWVTTGEIQFNTISDTVETITEAGLKNSAAKIFPPGTLLMAMYGQGKTRGQVAKLGISATTNQACAAILLDHGHDPEFFFQTLASHYEEIRELGNAGTQKNLNGGLIKKIVVPLPPLPEQQRISMVVGAWDTAIATTEKLHANSRRQKQIISQALLSGRRRLLQTEPWVKRTLSELIVESRLPGSTGAVARKITVKLYGKGAIAKEERRVGSDSTRYYRRVAGQFIYSKLDFLNGAFGLIPPELDGYESTLDLPAFDFHPEVDRRWFLYYVSREDFYQGHLGLANGGRKARRVNPPDLLRVGIRVPSLPEQKAIADAIDVAIADEKAWLTMLEALKAEKRALMQQLLTGKRRVRLPVSEAVRS